MAIPLHYSEKIREYFHWIRSLAQDSNVSKLPVWKEIEEDSENSSLTAAFVDGTEKIYIYTQLDSI